MGRPGIGAGGMTDRMSGFYATYDIDDGKGRKSGLREMCWWEVVSVGGPGKWLSVKLWMYPK